MKFCADCGKKRCRNSKKYCFSCFIKNKKRKNKCEICNGRVSSNVAKLCLSCYRKKVIKRVCIDCGKKLISKAKRCKKCHIVWYRGRHHHEWRGGIFVSSYGYLLIRIYDKHPFLQKSGVMPFHRYVMELWLRKNNLESEFLVEVNGKKYLNPDIHVHHMDGEKSNNKIYNLQCLTTKEHQNIHNIGKLSNFYIDGRSSHPKYKKKYREKNRERINYLKRLNYYKHKDKISVRKKERYKNDKEYRMKINKSNREKYHQKKNET